ncbi:MAG: hypothetical protein QGH14_05695, partial [Candidatus Bathyarchaeota archaeon]|nr:hypothetical protein [Candidatus Bathyarchaeota archaeon]
MREEERIRAIVKQELEEPLDEVKKSLKTSFSRQNISLKADLEDIATQIGELNTNLKAEIENISAQDKKEHIKVKDDIETLTGQLDSLDETLTILTSRIETFDDEISNRWSLVVKLRKYTLDQLMSEYKRLT